MRRAVLPQRLPAREPDSRLERSRLSRPLQGRDRPAARDQQLSRVHRQALPGAVRGGVRARDTGGRRGHDQADRERDHQPRLRGGLGRARASARGDRSGGGGGGLRAGGHGGGPAAAPGGPRRDAVRARRGHRWARAVRCAGLQDLKDGRRAAGRAAGRGGRPDALRRRCRARRERGRAALGLRRRRARHRLARAARPAGAGARARRRAFRDGLPVPAQPLGGERVRPRADRPGARGRAADNGEGR